MGARMIRGGSEEFGWVDVFEAWGRPPRAGGARALRSGGASAEFAEFEALSLCSDVTFPRMGNAGPADRALIRRAWAILQLGKTE
jgi:hypothetical protein